MPYQTLCSVIQNRSSIPILSQIHVAGNVAIATDMDTEVHQETLLEDGMYYHHGFDKDIAIKSKLPPGDFPLFDKLKFGEVVGRAQFDAHTIEALKWVAKAQSYEDARYYLNAVFFNINGDVVATDGHRLHMFNMEINWINTHTGGKLVNRRTIEILLKFIAEYDLKKISITFYQKGVEFESVYGRIKGRLVDATYPDYERLATKIDYPKENFAVFKPQELEEISEEVFCINRICGSRTCAIHIENQTITLPIAKSEDIDRVWACGINMPFKAGFNLHYLLQMPPGKMFYIDAVSPFKIVSNEGPIERVSIIMPVRA